ncbi:MAG: DUF4838 domain-containing protein [Limnochordia bacterium]
MRLKALISLLVLLLFALGVSAMASGLSVVDDGKARAVIVICPDADVQTQKAARVLVEYVRKSTGAQLPLIYGDRQEADGRIRIYVGESALEVQPDVTDELAALDEQGFVIRCQGDRIIIVGPSVWGTLHGVYDFLERYVGVRWLLPGPDGEDVPQLSSVVVPWGDIKDEPAFAYRTISPIRGSPDGSGATQWHNEWAQRNRLQGGYNDRIRFHHNLHSVFPPEKYGKTNCEFYPKCNPPGPDQKTGWQPCFTAPGSVETAVAEITAYFAQRPEETFFSLGVNDSRGHCEADPSHPDYPGKTNSIGMVHVSDIYYAWVNEVVTGVLEVYPDKWFGLLAYYEVMDPPSFPLHPRVIPFITKDRLSWIDDEIREAGYRQMEAWNEVAAQVAWYDYMYGGNLYVVPRIFSHVMAENFRYAKANNVVGTYTEMYHTVVDGPKPWLSARLQWNPDQDVDQLLDEWYVRAVGPEAAADLAAFYDLWEHFWTVRIKESPWFDSAKGRTYMPFNDQGYVHMVTDEDIKESKRLLASVVAKAQTPQQKARAALIQESFEYCEASVLSYPRQIQAPEDEAAALALLNGVGDILQERVEAATRRHALVASYGSNPLLRFFLPDRIGHWSGWPTEEFYHLARYMQEREPDGGPVTKQVEEWARLPRPRQRRAFAELLLHVHDGESSSTKASSFEDATETGRVWHKWIVSSGNIRRVEGTAYTGQASFLIEGMMRGGPHQTLDIQPGLVAVAARYFAPAGTEEGTIQLIFHLKNEQGANLTTYQTGRVPLASSAGAWSSLALLEEIPAMVDGQEVARAQVVVTIDSATNSTVYVDDVVVCHTKTAIPVSVYEEAIEFQGLAEAPKPVIGMLDARVALPLAEPEAIESVEILLDNLTIYRGSRLPTPGEVMIDTRTLPDRGHELTARILMTDIGTLTSSAAFVTRNFWTLWDPFEPPTETAWFGLIDRSRTSERSAGWRHATGCKEEFWGDETRLTRTGNSTEYLTWETPSLSEFSITLYAEDKEITEIVGVYVSADEETWQALPYEIKGAEQSADGRFRFHLEGAVPEPEGVASFRLVLRESSTYREIHLGEVSFRGFSQ